MKKKCRFSSGGGFIYVINCNNIYKIGVSKNVERRIKQLTKMPYPMICEYKKWVNNPYQIEDLFHKLFAEKHYNGEWFLLNEEDLKYIANMVEYGL